MTKPDDLLPEVEEQVDKIVDEYKKFAFKSNLLNMAIAFVLGSAFGKVAKSISENLIMPLIDYIVLQTGGDWRTHTWSPLTGLTFETGKFISTFVDFLLISIVLFVMWRFAKRVFDDNGNKHNQLSDK